MKIDYCRRYQTSPTPSEKLSKGLKHLPLVSMGVLIAKVVSMVLLGAISMFVGILPMVFRRFCGLGDRRTSRGGQLLISALLCFGGGVILTTSFTHVSFVPLVGTFCFLIRTFTSLNTLWCLKRDTGRSFGTLTSI